MAEFLLELFSEEIPARMQGLAGRDLERLARAYLSSADVAFSSARSFAGPRRLTLVIDGLPEMQADRMESRRGPKLNAPVQALDGFLRATGLERHDLFERDGAYYASIPHPGRATAELLGEMTSGILSSFPWPKSMRSGMGTFRWVRPLRRILCLFDGVVVPVEAGGVVAADLTEGHRFMTAGPPMAVLDFSDYRMVLESRSVILDAAERRAKIAAGAQGVCLAQGLELVCDEGLLDEVCGLAEWPTPMLGAMDPQFLDLPAEVIRTSMRTHQKYFAARDPATSGLAPYFVVVANIEPVDGGAALIAGNAKVLSARLNDARFFWNEDQKVPLEARLAKLDGVIFHARLGTLRARAERIEVLAKTLARRIGTDPLLAGIAARLAKADLTTGMVGEFPELQGVMGGHYARLEGRGAGASPAVGWAANLDQNGVDAVADAIRDHYRPAGPADAAPTAPTTAAVALADKLDTLAGFFAINERPTGSKDPFALRRAALGVIRILIQGRFEISLRAAIDDALQGLLTNGLSGEERTVLSDRRAREDVRDGLASFFAERLKAALKDDGRRHDLVDAVFALGGDNLVSVATRVEGLSLFLAGEDGASLLSGYRRAVNILKAEEKRGPTALPGAGAGRSGPVAPEEASLEEALGVVEKGVDVALGQNDYMEAMRHLAKLRPPVDAFFERVLVNDPDPIVRSARLKLLTQVRDTANRVADFSLISG